MLNTYYNGNIAVLHQTFLRVMKKIVLLEASLTRDNLSKSQLMMRAIAHRILTQVLQMHF